jgi:uncharacterized membrane protein HdeD (DUF308 family)
VWQPELETYRALKGTELGRKNKTGRRRPIVSGFVLLGLGLLLLFDSLDALEYTWPILLILVGVALIFGRYFNRREETYDASPPPPPPVK